MHDAMGTIVKDKITGFEGRVTGYAEYITGCSQLLVQPPLDKEGKFVDARWIDADRLDVTEAPAMVLAIEKPGPDMAAPIR